MADGPVLRSKPLGGVDSPPRLELELECMFLHCCKGDERFQRERPFLGYRSSEILRLIFKKIGTIGDETQHANFDVSLFKGGVSAHA